MTEISVIVPVYRAETFLRRCTDSILGQSFLDFELLLIDDGSPDGSGALCDVIAGEDARVRVFHQENGGVSSARNLGLSQAKGRLISFVDADDWLASDALSELHALLCREGADTAGCAHFKANPDGSNEVERGALPSGVYDQLAIREGIVNRLLGERVGSPSELLNGFVWRFLFDRDIISQGSLSFVGAYLEDELFLMEYFCHAKRLAMSDKPLYYYLQNPQSVTRNYLPDYMDTFARFMQLKEALVSRFDLEKEKPLWRESSNWSGLIIAVGNEFAPGNPASLREKCANMKAIASRPDMQAAIRGLHPKGLSTNKKLVVELLRLRQYWLLGLLYTVKNQGT